MAKNRNPVSLAADRASKAFCSATERSGDNPASSNIQSPPCRILSREETTSNNLFASVSTCILGVDPGLGGAVMFYFPGHDRLTGDDMPVVGGDVDPATLAARIALMQPEVAIVELVASRPGQGVASVFKFGCGFGMVRGVIAASGVPLHLVSPSRWKRHFGLDSDKEKSRALALRLWPGRSDLFGKKKDHGKAEAALLARDFAETREARS